MEIIRKKSGRPSKRPSSYELNLKYQAMTAKELAEEYGVKESTVRSWIRLARKEAEVENAKK